MTQVTLERIDTGREHTAASTSGRDRLRCSFPWCRACCLSDFLSALPQPSSFAACLRRRRSPATYMRTAPC